MQRAAQPTSHTVRWLRMLLLLPAIAFAAHAQNSTAGGDAFTVYAQAVENRLAQQHATRDFSPTPISPADQVRLHHGELLLNHLTEPNTPAPSHSGTMLHHWQGTAFVPGATAAAFEHLLRDLPAYPQHFAPEVLRASLNTSAGDHLQTTLRVREHHVLTVTLDTAYDLTFSHPGPRRGSCTSRSTRITEIANPGTPAEHPLSPADAHGFLLRLNTYWTWQERDGGLYLQVETVSLSRAIPQGLSWALRPYVDSVPRDSLAFTLRSAREALMP